MFTKCPVCGKTVFTLIGTVKTCPKCGSELSGTKAPLNTRAEAGLQFPQRENASLEDGLKSQLTTSYEGGGIGETTIMGSWEDFFSRRQFDAPFFTALNNRACILVSFSSRSLESEKQLEQLLNPRIRLPLQIESFLGGPFPVIRCSLVIPDDPGNPLVLEAALNIRDGDVQDFFQATLADEYVDLILKHEDSEGRYFSVAYHAPGLSEVVKRELHRTLGGLKPAATREDFQKSSKAMESVFPTATAGVEPKKCITLTLSGKARNELMVYGDSVKNAKDDPMREVMVGAEGSYDKGNFEAAIAGYTQAIHLDPKYAPAFFNRGLVYLAKDDLDAALQDFDEAIALNPKLSEAYDNRGGVYRKKGNLGAAIANFSQAIALNSKSATTYANRGNVYYEKDDFDASVADHTKAIELDPQFVGAYFSRGIAYAGKFDLLRAKKDFDQVLKMDPNFPQSAAIKQYLTIFEVAGEAEAIIRGHLERMGREFKKQPGFAITDAVAKKLLRSDVLVFTLKAVIEELPESLQNKEHRWQSQKFDDLCLIISIVPALDAGEASAYFEGRYLAFIEDELRGLGGDFGQVNFVHWVLCSDSNKMGVHLTIIPAGENGMFLFAMEMLNENEKAQLGF